MVHYINTYTETPEKHKEIRWKTLNWPLIILVNLALFLLIGGLLIGGFYGVAYKNTPLAIYSFVMAATFALSGVIFPNTIFRHLQMPKKYLEITAEFLDEEVQVSASNGKNRSFNYKKICKIKETKNYFIIIFKETEDAKSYLSVKKDSFTIGSASTFLNFLSFKGFSVL